MFLGSFLLLIYNEFPGRKLNMQFEVKEELYLDKCSVFSKRGMDQHFRIYKQYVSQCNGLDAELNAMRDTGHDGSNLYFDRRRRYLYELGSKNLYELYLEGFLGDYHHPPKELLTLIESSFSNFEAWKNDFIKCGLTRGNGWAIASLDPNSGQIFNLWLEAQFPGVIPGFPSLLVLNCQDNAYILDYGVDGLESYLSKALDHINFEVMQNRVESSSFSSPS